MPFTGVLAKSDSYLGNFVLGIVGGPSLEQIVTDSLTFTEIYHANDIEKNVFDSLIFSETIGLAGSRSITITDSLVFIEAITRQAKLHLPVTDTLTLTHTQDGFAAKAVYDTLVFTEAIAVVHTSNITKNDILVFVETIDLSIVKAVINLNPPDVLSFDEIYTKVRVRHAVATDTLTFTEHLISGDEKTLSISDSLVFVEVITKKRVRHKTVTDSLVFTEAIARQGTINLTVADVLTIVEGAEKPVNIGTVDSINVPGIQVVKVKANCMVLLQGTDLSITLPCPEFNDSESFQGQLKILRTMTGNKRIYKQSTNKYKLSYDFIINRLKAYELRNFIIEQNNKSFKMTNWKGEIWYVTFANNPFTFTETSFWGDNCGNKFTIPLEFEGVRLN